MVRTTSRPADCGSVGTESKADVGIGVRCDSCDAEFGRRVPLLLLPFVDSVAQKSFLAGGFPIPTSVTANANVSNRPDLDSFRGGQAAVAVGYKTNHFGRGQHAILIRSSWGTKWGDNGNGFLPIAFLRSQLARGFWTLRERAMAEYGRIVPVC